MKKPLVRLVLVLLALAGVGGATYYAFLLEQRSASVREADRAFTEDVVRLQATLADLRAAQAGYLAMGQDTAAWIEKTNQLRQQADTQVRRLAESAAGTDLEGTIATVTESLSSFGRFDTRVKEVLRNEELQTASRLIFSDSAQVLAAAVASLSTARGTHATRTGIALAGLRRLQMWALGGAAGVVLLALLLLLPSGRSGPDVEEATESTEAAFGESPSDTTSAAERTGLGLDFDLSPTGRARVHDEPAAERPALAGTARADAQKASLSPVRGDSREAAPETTLDLAAAARLCTDLARVHDTSELQGLLARAASLLDASGIVVWMGSAGGDVLWPAFSHGYSPQALTKMQALPRDAATPVSEAFRKGLMEVVPAGDRGSGAIVAPILAASGCVGAMAVEIRHGAEASDAEQALASIVAAQLATLVAGETGQ